MLPILTDTNHLPYSNKYYTCCNFDKINQNDNEHDKIIDFNNFIGSVFSNDFMLGSFVNILLGNSFNVTTSNMMFIQILI